MKRPKNLRVTVNSLSKIEKMTEKLFFDILEDYCTRFKVLPTRKKIDVMICFIEYAADSITSGMVIYEMDKDSRKIIVQIRDPLLNGWELNNFALTKFINIICHEFVHVCQRLTGRNGSPIRGLAYDRKDDQEAYLFAPCEVEARALEAPYTALYGKPFYE